jgi:Ras-related protein Rab-7A
LKYFL